MPGYDGTGPLGMGPGSGGGFGNCGNNAGAAGGGCRRKGGTGRKKGNRSGFGQGGGQGMGKQMMRGFGSREDLISPEEDLGRARFSGTKWFQRRNRP